LRKKRWVKFFHIRGDQSCRGKGKIKQIKRRRKDRGESSRFRCELSLTDFTEISEGYVLSYSEGESDLWEAK